VPESIDTSKHLQRITEAIDELMAFHARTADPAPIPHQYIGTTIDNTVGLLAAPANALDGGTRALRFSDIHNWLSLMQAVHRSFFSSLQLAIEAGLVAICRERGLQVPSRLRHRMKSAIEKIEKAAGDNDEVHEAIKDLCTFLKSYRPSFNDYLESVLAISLLPRTTKTQWRRFFRALSIIRNKASHSDSSLTENERKALIDGGCRRMISTTGELVMNPRMYAQFVTFSLQFFDLVCGAAAPGSDKSGPDAR
jgi:hypothetical protein